MKLVIAGLLTCLTLATATAPPGEQSPRPRRGPAIEAMIEGSGDESLRQFIETQLAPEYRASFAPGALEEHLRKIRAACRNFDAVLAGPAGEGRMRLSFAHGSNETSVLFRVQQVAPYLIVELTLAPLRPSQDVPQALPVPRFTWSTLAAGLDLEAEAGFSGTVLVVRDGRIVLHQGYGLANYDYLIPNTTETVYAIGSVPIDFTKAAILKLEDLGRLRTSDSITKYFANVPTDKRGITLDQLMHGTSGLPNFHHNVGDPDKDLSWIDRDEAVRRILGRELLFAPGAGDAHSHSAWVLLAAIVEIVSKQTYGDFLRQHFFKPAGMTRTGLHEDAARMKDYELATGYGGDAVGKLNMPKYWGRTSWLVMGSGGMQSTPYDLYRWMTAIREGKTLSAAAGAKYWTNGVTAGADDRGFYCLFTEGPRDLMIMCSNSNSRTGPGRLAGEVGRGLVELVMGRPMRRPNQAEVER